MLNKDDKKFIVDLVTSQINNLDKKLSAKIDGVKTGLEGRMDGLETQIRHNGVLIEKMQDDIDFLVEGHETLNARLTRVETSVTKIEETIFDYPVLRDVVKEHSKLLAAR